ncbi:hypothetical protein K493DRAFT_312252 [Basidiobolus meristosporus CBS 931.73]|uniref:MD-2-related lipid-recognition domain-containing protein n=1 Tax=Basidiobolus meristosporus CBS 931.73 TaxID=1314790 RepID=A0A1Y1YV56_9FUNG|nr:hypothetical protein K493DRAFT_312252 [Basidiobolus meristosporus CBS 931.73]|eukprot:ORY01859.1 hypothetical protein K493DRAFT_312252 [Basidiobolus meristosporus CBS 931.73]
MILTPLVALAMVGSTLAAPLPKICKQNVALQAPKEIQAGCSMRLRISIPAHVLSTVESLDVKLYPGKSHRGTLVHQVQTKDILSNQENIDMMFPVTSKFLGSNTLILTETSHNGMGCPTVYGAQELVVHPRRAGVICTY